MNIFMKSPRNPNGLDPCPPPGPISLIQAMVCPVRSIAVTGATGPIGHRLVELLRSPAAGEAEEVRVVAIDWAVAVPEARVVGGNGSSSAQAGRSGGVLDGCDTVIHLDWDEGSARVAPPAGGDANVVGTRRLLEAAAHAGVGTVVHLSSATVYGGWSDNAIPLTEEAAIRPNPGVDDAIHHAEAERVVGEWADAHPDVHVAVLRPVTIVGPGVSGWLTAALGEQAPLRPHQLDPPRQFLHCDDLVGALRTAALGQLDGIFNVAPDGWVGGEALRVLGSGRPVLEAPRRVATAITGWSWRLHLSGLPPQVLPLIEQPWVVANDRLRAAGWVPAHTNEEAVVAARPGSWWREMSPTRRQEVALSGAGLAAVATTASAVTAIAARRRRRNRQ
ncbi:MAG: hypothetical protein NVS3B21_05760 [Acidimicrobiales bacterium]